MSKLSIDEIKQLRLQLETRLLAEVKLFERNTGVTIRQIDTIREVHQETEGSGGIKEILTGVGLTLEVNM